MRAKSSEVYTGRAVQREDEADGDIGNPRSEGERENENEGRMPSSLYRSPPVGGFVGVEGEIPHRVVGDAGVVATAAAMGNEGMPRG